MPEYMPRIVDDELDELLVELPAVALEGPKGVGKTATALRRARTVYRLDDPAQQEIFRAEPSRLVSGEPPILLDEWQRIPESWDLVRRAVDDGAPPGQFVLTGSALPVGVSTHSGAGRIVSLRMRPLTLVERGIGPATVSLGALLRGDRPDVSGSSSVSLAGYVEEVVGSGFPGLRQLTARSRRAQLDGYVERIITREFEDLGHRIRNPGALRRWMTAYAAASSTTATYETIRDAATSGVGDKPAKTTTQPYREVLEHLWILEPVPGWLPSRSEVSRLTAAPKHHLAEPALAAHLLGGDADALLQAVDLGPPVPRYGTLLGALFESLVTLCVRVSAQAAEARVRHLRTRGGEHEIDLIVERGDHRVVAIEVKLRHTVQDDDVRHLLWLQGQLGDDLLDAVVVTTGVEAYRRSDGIAVVPAALLGP